VTVRSLVMVALFAFPGPPLALSQTPPPLPPHVCRFVKILNSIAGDTVIRNDYRFFAADGYILVFQDIRGRYGSEGKFIMQR